MCDGEDNILKTVRSRQRRMRRREGLGRHVHGNMGEEPSNTPGVKRAWRVGHVSPGEMREPQAIWEARNRKNCP